MHFPAAHPGARLGRRAHPGLGGRFKSGEGAGQQGTDEALTESILSPASNFARAMGGTTSAWRAEKVPARH